MDKQSNLEHELEELFDIRFARSRGQKYIDDAAVLAQRDIRHLTRMFCDGIPDVSIPVGDEEFIKWDSTCKRLFLVEGESSQLLETSSKHTMIRIRPHLSLLVKAAKEFF